MSGRLRFWRPGSFLELLLAAFLVFAVPFFAVGGWMVITMERLVQEGGSVLDATLDAGALRRQVDRQLAGLERSAKQWQVLGDPLLRVQVEALHARLDTTLARHANDSRDEGERAAVDALRRQAAGIVGALMQSAPEETAFARAVADFDRLGVLAQQLEQAGDTAQERRISLLRERVGRLARYLAVAAITMLAGGIGLAFLLARMLARPVATLDAAVGGLGDGGLTSPVQVRGPRDLVALGDRIEWLRQRLADVERQRIRYLQHVSHDLKTPLAALREGTSLLSDGSLGALTDGQREVAGILVDNARRLQRQLERLLAFAGTPPADAVRRQPVRIDALVRRVVESQRLQSAARQIDVDLQGVKPMRAAVDEDMFRVIVDNLLSNAIRFSPPNGRIVFTLDETPDTLKLRVSDQGPGVPLLHRERIFEPFFTLGPQGEADDGTGLGLAIAREHARLHGGDLRLVPNEEGQPGACFELEIPDHR